MHYLWLLVDQEAAFFLYYAGLAAAQISKGLTLASAVGVVWTQPMSNIIMLSPLLVLSQRKCFCWFPRLHMLLNQTFIHPISRVRPQLRRAWKGGYGALTCRRSGRRFLFFYSNSSLLQVLSLSSTGVCHVFSLMNIITLLRIVDGLVWAFPWLWQLASTYPFPSDPRQSSSNWNLKQCSD